MKMSLESRIIISASVVVALYLKSDLFMEIFRVFREKKIEMPFPQQDVHVRSINAPMVIANPPGRSSETAGAGEHAA
jgi:small-conductance mechanosensitive channel